MILYAEPETYMPLPLSVLHPFRQAYCRDTHLKLPNADIIPLIDIHIGDPQ